MNKFTNHSMDEIMLFNPAESIKKDSTAKKVPMGMLDTFSRKINGYEISIYSTGPKFRNGDTLLAKITPCLENGKTALVNILDNGEVAFGSSEFIVLRAIDYISDSKFNYYLTRSPAFRDKAIKCMEGTSGRKRVNEGALKKQVLPIPDLESQKSIADTLSALDDKIELNNRMNGELEKMARTLYDYWFVQFDFPDENKRPYKSAGGEMVFSPALGREIPAGWVVGNLADNPLTKIIKPGIERFDGEKIYLATACIENDRITDCTNKITFANREGRANMQPVANSVWFAKMKNTKKVLYFGDYSTKRMEGIILSTGMLGLQCAPAAMEYVWGFVNNDGFEAVKNKLAHGATQEGVNNTDLEHFPILCPLPEVLKQYAALASGIFQQKYMNEQESERLAEIRDFLLPMLMNGQVAVSN